MSIQQAKIRAIIEKIWSKLTNPQPMCGDDIANAIDDVYEAGKNKGLKEWMDIHIKSHNANGWHFGFSTWNVHNYKLTIPITKIKGADQMYRYFNYYYDVATQSTSSPVDLVELHKELGIPDIDWSTATESCYQTFYYAKISRLGVINLSNANHTQFFTNMSYLKTIDMLMLNPSATNTSLFNGCTKLAYIRMGNNITKTLSFSSCPLDLESGIDVLEHLENYKGTDKEGTNTISLKASTWDLLDAHSGKEVDGVIYTWREYILNVKGWTY